MTKMKMAILALLASSVPVTGAQAATVIKSLQLDATNISDGLGDVSVGFSLNFDNSSDFTGNFIGVATLFNNSFGPLQIGYSASSDVLTLVGGNGTANPGGCGTGLNAFCSFISGISSASPTSNFLLRNGGNGNGFASNVTISAAGAVPEPAAWAFMIFGFGAIGGAMRRQRKTSVKVSYA